MMTRLISFAFGRSWPAWLVAFGVLALVWTGASKAWAQESEDLPVIQLSVSPSTVSEGDGNVQVVVTAEISSGEPVSSDVAVWVSTVGELAVADTDFTPFDSYLIIPSGEISTSGTFDLVIVDDNDVEDIETIDIYGDLYDYSIGLRGVWNTRISIIDNDGTKPYLTDGYVVEDSWSPNKRQGILSGILSEDGDFVSGSAMPVDKFGTQDIDIIADAPAIPVFSEEGCSDGTYVADPNTNPGTVSDCEALVAIRNHFIENPDNADLLYYHPFKNWQGDVTGWLGTGWSDYRLESLSIEGTNRASYKLRGTIPEELGDLSTLRTLNFSRNYLVGPIPEELGDLDMLRTLNLSDNGLTYIPEELGDLDMLRTLNLSRNKLSSNPVSLGSLPNLRVLDLSWNYFPGSIPDELGNLTNLEYLGLSFSVFSYPHSDPIPSSLGRLSKLRTLLLQGNRLSGSIPSELGNLTQLRTLRLENNWLTGPIPDELGNLSQLITLNLSNNRLSGTIPSSFRNLSNLKFLGLVYFYFQPYYSANDGWKDEGCSTANEGLSGPIPSFLGDLSDLRYIDLRNNSFTGSIPTSLGNLDQLFLLKLHCNFLTGAIPSTITISPRSEQVVPRNLDGRGWDGRGWFSFCQNFLSGALPKSLRPTARMAIDFEFEGDADDITTCQRRPEITLTADAWYLREGHPTASSASVTVTASLDTGLVAPVGGQSVTVSVGNIGDSAVEGTDYTEVDDFVITIAEGEILGSGSFDLTVIDDNIVEDYETLSLSGSSGKLEMRIRSRWGGPIEIQSDEVHPYWIDLSVDANGDEAGSPTTVEEGSSSNVVVTAAFRTEARTGVLPSDTVVSVSVSGDGGDGQAESDDFTAVDDFDVTIPAGATSGSASFTLTTAADEVDEGEEALTVSGTTTAARFRSVTGAELSITDNDSAPTVSRPTAIALSVDANGDGAGVPTGVTEGADAAVRVTASFPEGSQVLDTGTEITVSVGKRGDSATSGTDYTAVNDFSITIPAGKRSGAGSFTLAGTDDGVAGEGAESVTVSGVAAGFEVSDATVSITDGDSAPTAISLSVAPTAAGESATARSVAVTASFPEGSDILTVDTVVTASVGEKGDSAVSGTDYSAVSDFTVTIPAGRRSGAGKFVLAGTNDNVAGEGAESLTVSGAAAGFTVSDASFSLTDGDAAPTLIRMSVSPAQTAENESPESITVTVAFPTGSASLTADTAVTVSVGEKGDSAVSGVDYAAVGDFTVTIPAGMTSGSGSFSLAGTDDGVAGEGAESLTVSGAAAGFTVSGASVSLTDGDAAPTSVSLAVDATSVAEGAAAQTITVTASFPADSAVLNRDETALVSVGAEGDGAAEGTDYRTVSDLRVTISGGQRSGTATFSLRVIDDDIAEGSESLTISGTLAGYAIGATKIAIADNDADPSSIGLRVAPAKAAEGGEPTEVTVTAALPEGSAVLASDTAVAVSVGADDDSAASGADYAAVGDFTVTIAAGERSGSGSFRLRGTDDNVAGEGAESLTVSGTATGFAVADASVTITDEDVAPTDIGLSVSSAKAAESGTSQSVAVTAAFPEGSAVLASDTAVAVSVGADDDSAASGADYVAVGDFTVTIAAGERSGSGSFRLRGTDDNVAGEGAESLTVSGTAAGFAISDASVSITDGDAVPTRIGLSVSPDSAGESASAQSVAVTVAFPEGSAVLASDTAVAVSVGADNDSAASGTDYAAVGDFTVTIAAGERSGSGKFVLAGTDDDVAGEGAESLTVSGAAAGFVIPDASLSITDGDAVPTGIDLSASPDSVEEGSGSVKVTVTASLPEGSAALASDTTVAASVGQAGDGAASGTDYGAVADFTITIPAGKRSGSGRFVLAVTDDDTAEGAESLTISGTATGFTVSAASVAIADDDAVVVTEQLITLGVAPGSVDEDGGEASLRVSASLPEGTTAPAGGIMVGASVGGVGDSAAAGTDYERVNGLLVEIAAGKRSGWVDFRLNVVDDDAAEGPESVSITGATLGYRVSGTSLTINDNDQEGGTSPGGGPGDGGGSPGPTASASQQQEPPPPQPVDPPPPAPPAPPTTSSPPSAPLPPPAPPPAPPAPVAPPSGGGSAPPNAPSAPPDPVAPPVGETDGVAPAPVEPVEERCVGRFCDEDESVHQTNIEQAADWGITNGCGEGRFCPGLSISRSQMAAFLYRAVAHRSGVPPSVARFTGLSDVGEGAWYGVFARWAVAAGVMSARGGEFDPGGVVTRGDMALMLAAAFPDLATGSAAVGIFQDLDASEEAARAAEALHRAGVTRGCSTSPLRFCPDQPVTRSQMASFFVRALTALR